MLASGPINFTKFNRNHEVLQEKSQHVTRFIGLGKVNNPKKLKWLYAFNIVPMANMTVQKLNEQPAGATPCPYEEVVDEQEKSEARKVNKTIYFYELNIDLN